MNTRLFLAGCLVFIAGANSDDPSAWVVWAFGLAMIAAALLRPLMDRLERPQIAPGAPSAASGAQPPQRERIVRERWRESRERYWPFDRAA